MALPAKLPDIPATIPTPLRLVEPLPTDIDPESLDSHNRRTAEKLKSVVERSEQTLASISEYLEMVKSKDLTDRDLDLIDDFIDALSAMIRAVSTDLRETDPKLERLISRARKLSVQEPGWKTHADLLQRYLDSLFEQQNALDSMRTAFLAVLGSNEKGEGPVFDDPDELRAHLESIVKA
jgi:hypothetical protein